MQPVKQEALNTISQLPEDVDMDKIMYRLYVVDKTRKGQQAIEDGQTNVILICLSKPSC